MRVSARSQVTVRVTNGSKWGSRGSYATAGLQESGNEPRVVGYASKQLLPREQTFSAIDRELLAITFGLLHFEQHLFGSQGKLLSDHKPLQ